MPRVLVPFVLLALLALAAGCGDDAAGGAQVRVAATTGQVADLAREVGGDRAAVDQLLPANADPHDHEPRPSDARAVAEADVVLRSGGDLDAWLTDVLEGAGVDAEAVTLAEAVGAGDAPDPHWWQDPRNAVRAVERIRAVLTEADPEGAAAYRGNAARYTRRIEATDRAIARCMAAIPRERRKLVTNHDAFGFFAARYGIEVLGSIVPGRSTSAQPSAGDVRELVAAIRRERVRTIFPESSLGGRLERAVARDAGARVGPALYADALGEPGTPGATYLDALRHDAAAMAEGFGGDCALPRD